MVFIPRTYARAAGIQSEISKVAVTQIAHLENDYRRQIHMAKMDMRKSMREIKHNRAKMRRAVFHYHKKLQEYKKAKQKKYYDNLDLNQTVPSKSRSQEISKDDDVVIGRSNEEIDEQANVNETGNMTITNNDSNGEKSRINSDLSQEPLVSSGTEIRVTSPEHCAEGDESNAEDSTGKVTSHDEQSTSPQETSLKSTSIASNPESQRHGSSKKDSSEGVREDNEGIADDDKAVKYPRKRRSGLVNHINIVKLQYRPNVKDLFRAVDVLAKVHGVNYTNTSDKKIRDPRKLSQERQISRATHDLTYHGTLPSEYLYNMKYGYATSKNQLDANPIRYTSSADTLNTEGEMKGKVVSLHCFPRIPLTESPGIQMTTTQEKRKISRNSSHDFPVKSRNLSPDAPLKSKTAARDNPLESKRTSRSSYQDNELTEKSTYGLKLPAIKHKQSVNTRSKEGSKVSLPMIYSERYFERKISKGETENVHWETALGKLKLVHFIDTRDL